MAVTEIAIIGTLTNNTEANTMPGSVPLIPAVSMYTQTMAATHANTIAALTATEPHQAHLRPGARRAADITARPLSDTPPTMNHRSLQYIGRDMGAINMITSNDAARPTGTA